MYKNKIRKRQWFEFSTNLNAEEPYSSYQLLICLEYWNFFVAREKEKNQRQQNVSQILIKDKKRQGKKRSKIKNYLAKKKVLI